MPAEFCTRKGLSTLSGKYEQEKNGKLNCTNQSGGSVIDYALMQKLQNATNFKTGS